MLLKETYVLGNTAMSMNPNNLNPNMEIPKIPLMTLAGITSLTDVLHELPLPGPHPDSLEYPLFAYSTIPMPGIKRLINNTDKNNVSNVIDALSQTNTEDIILKDPSQDTDCLDGLNVPPLLQAILTKKPDVFYRRRTFVNDVGGNIKHSSPAQAATPQSPAISYTGLPMYQASPAECASEISSSQFKTDPNQVNRSQIPHSTCSENRDTPSSSKNEFTVENPTNQVQEENPKICLKIRKKKKNNKDKEQPKSSEMKSSNGSIDLTTNDVCYDIVSSPSKQPGLSSPGSLKLKLSRIKTEPGTNSDFPAFEVADSNKTPESLNNQQQPQVQSSNDTLQRSGAPMINQTRLAPAPSYRPPLSNNSSSNAMSQHSSQNNTTPPQYPNVALPFSSPPAARSTDSYLPFARPPSFANTDLNVNTRAGPPHSHQRQPMPPPPPYASPHAKNITPEQLANMASNFSPSPVSLSQHKQRQNRSNSESSGKTPSSKPRKKGSKHIRVKFIADQEEADIHKLSDVMYPDDSEVSSFDELKSGMMVIAKWPQNGKLYDALVIDPLDNTGRKFRERKPPPKPFQADPRKKDRKNSSESIGSPRVMLEPLSFQYSNNFDADKQHFTLDGQFTAYHSMADRIKLKRQQRLLGSGSSGKKRKRTDSSDPTSKSLITLHSDDEGDEWRDESSSPARKISHKDSRKKKERRRLAEMRLMQEGGNVSGSLRRFNTVVELIFEDMDRLDATSLQCGPDDLVPECLLIPASRLRELSSESAKLKAMGILNQVPRKNLSRLMTILEPNIRIAVKLNPLSVKGDITPQEQKWQQELALERVYAAADSALTALNLMTSPGMPKSVFIEDVMERAIQLLRFQLTNTIYPEYDTVYKIHSKTKKGSSGKDLHTASSRQKRAHYKGTKSRAVSHLYNKMISLMTLWEELLHIQPLTDTSVLQVSSVAISPFFVENVRELQLSAIQLTTIIFARYERHRKIILEDIFQSLARLPTSKRNLRSFRLNYVDEDYSDDEDISSNQVMPYIQMVSALVLQMIQAIVMLPLTEQENDKNEGDNKEKVDELKVIRSYDSAMRMGQSFLAVFLKKCASKSEEIDYRPLFENFIHDLLATVNKPEWPASEMMLSILGRLLVHTFSNKQTEASLRVASIDYLGVIAAKLRRDSVSSQLDKNIIKQLISNLDKAAKDELENPKAETGEKKDDKDEEGNKENKREETYEEAEKENSIEHRLHNILLDYVRSNADADPALMFAHNFYIGQWLRDVTREAGELQNTKTENKDIDGEVEAIDKQNNLLQECEHRKKQILELASDTAAEQAKQNEITETMQSNENGVVNATPTTPLKRKNKNVSAQLTYDNATLMTRYLASNRPFSHSFDTYLTHILHIREEAAVAVRTRAIKCLAEVVAVDPSILARKDIWQGVQASLMDGSTSVREAAIDLVGKFILLKPELVPQYYKMLTARILDTGVSVRKRVIKILRDLCHEHPDLPQLTDACVRIIRRVNDEEGIKKLVHEVFMRMWFTPLKNKDAHSMRLKALSIADVVAANKDIGYEWIEQMMVNLIDTDIVNETVELACQQIVDCLVDHLIQIEQENQSKDEKDENALETEASGAVSESTENTDIKSDDEGIATDVSNKEDLRNKNEAVANALRGRKPVEMIAATMRTLVLFAKIRPKLLVPHVMTLQPHLTTKCESPDELQTLQSVCRVLELAVPHLEHPGEAFLASLEEDLMKLILREKFLVVKSAIACLGSVTRHITENYKLVWDCFQKLCSFLSGMRTLHQKSGFSQAFNVKSSQLLRTLFITGHLMKTFDFDEELMKGSLQVCIKDKVYECIYYFTQLQSHEELRLYAIGSLGLLMIQDPNMMFRTETKECYKHLLEPNQPSDALKNQVLVNLQTYLSEEDVRMQEAAKLSSHKKKEDPSTMGLHARKQFEQQQHQQEEAEDIKEICDVSSGMASSVMQVYLKQVLECFFHPHLHVRNAALNTIYLTLNQGLVHPLQCVPFVIAMSTDSDPALFNKSEQLLGEISKKYSGFIHAKALQGVKMAFRLQSSVTESKYVTRGCRAMRGSDEVAGFNKACCSPLYMTIRGDRKYRRGLMLGLLNLFDDTVKSDLGLLLFVADNLAYFPYVTQDEPLYVMSQIEVYVSVSGSNVLQSFKECLLTKPVKVKKLKKKKSPKQDASPSTSPIHRLSSSSSSSSSEDEHLENDLSDTEDEIGIISRLPNNDLPLREFMESSMACLLLLWVKQHLKTVFGFTDNKIHRYSPSEPVKAHDKQVLKKRPDLLFEPNQVINYLDRRIHGKLPTHLSQDEDFKKLIAQQYFKFHELMNKLDPNDSDSESDKETPTKKTGKKQPANATNADSSHGEDNHAIQEKINDNAIIDENSDRDSDAEMPKKATALDLIRSSGMSKHKKKLLKSKHTHQTRPESPSIPKELRARKKVVQYVESSDSDDSESEFLGF
uniref:nipped-B-like protein A isoform X2 n=1 Tax=Styela clava TaxID=7725 RepID=UPI001939F982|nr:nipped-B-like protein A isoform X2 [Styela clava]